MRNCVLTNLINQITIPIPVLVIDQSDVLLSRYTVL